MQLKDVIEKNYIIEETNDINCITDLKRMWSSRLKKYLRNSNKRTEIRSLPKCELSKTYGRQFYTKVDKVNNVFFYSYFWYDILMNLILNYLNELETRSS